MEDLSDGGIRRDMGSAFTLGIEDALNRHVALLASKLSAANRRKRAILDPPRATP